MFNSYTRTFSVALLAIICMYPVVNEAKGKKPRKASPAKKHGARAQKQVLPQGQLPSGMQLIKRTLSLCDQNLVNNLLERAGLAAKSINKPISDEDMTKVILVLEGKDLIAIFDTYLSGFISNPEPFSWDIARMQTFIEIASHRLSDKNILLIDFEKNQAYYKSEFGINSFPTFTRTLRGLVDESNQLYKELKDINRLSATGVLTSLQAYLVRLQTRMPHKLSEIIKTQLNGSSGIGAKIQLVSQVRQRLSRK